MQVVNPSTGRVGARFEEMDQAALRAAIDRSERALASWRETSFEERAALLRRVAERLRLGREAFAARMAEEMGKPVRQGLAEVDKCARVCEHYAEHSREYLRSEPVELGEGADAVVAYRPLGVVLAIMPWNFPFWQALRQAAPALMAGNTVLLKHAENVPGCAEDIKRVFADAGAPEGVFENLRIELDLVAGVIDDPRVRMVTLTGSVRAGRSVGARAGAALTKTVLELGGSDPYLILHDADIERAAEACVKSRMINSGQSCVAAKRWIVVDSVYDPFLERCVELMGALRLADPTDEQTEVGPLAREDLRDTLHQQVQRSLRLGATLALGGEVPEAPGWWYPPTILTDVAPGMPAFDEELFGPVAAVVRADDERSAIELANQTSFGLGAAVFTRDLERGRDIAERRLRAGNCFVNTFVHSDPRLPFGGVGDSGYGRELARHGILELVYAKTVYVKTA